jgi:hypothetical protein
VPQVIKAPMPVVEKPKVKKTMISFGRNEKFGQRILCLKQLKDVIQDIYSCKIKFDRKCEALKQPRETMEQYMYTYLN